MSVESFRISSHLLYYKDNVSKHVCVLLGVPVPCGAHSCKIFVDEVGICAYSHNSNCRVWLIPPYLCFSIQVIDSVLLLRAECLRVTKWCFWHKPRALTRR